MSELEGKTLEKLQKDLLSILLHTEFTLIEALTVVKLVHEWTKTGSITLSSWWRIWQFFQTLVLIQTGQTTFYFILNLSFSSNLIVTEHIVFVWHVETSLTYELNL